VLLICVPQETEAVLEKRIVLVRNHVRQVAETVPAAPPPSEKKSTSAVFAPLSSPLRTALLIASLSQRAEASCWWLVVMRRVTPLLAGGGMGGGLPPPAPERASKPRPVVDIYVKQNASRAASLAGRAPVRGSSGLFRYYRRIA
jgi:hypothetical protein